MSEQTVTGICTEIAQKPGVEWVEFHIDSGGKFPVKLSTKQLPLIELGRAVGGQLATWTYKETDGNPNPHKPGEFYKNRWLESVEVGGTQNPTGSVATPDAAPREGMSRDSVTGQTAPTNAPGYKSATAQRPPVLGGDKDRLIVRQTCIKAAAALYQGMGYWSLTGKMDEIADTALAVITAAARFETWCYRDLEPPPF